MRILIAPLTILVTGVGVAGQAFDPVKFEPADPFAAVDRDPVRIGELYLILGRRMGLDKIDLATDQIRQATALLLVRRRLAMQRLRQQGGAELKSTIDRKVERARDELRRRDTSLAAHAASLRSDEASYLNDLSWRIAWSQYVKSKLTEQNLRRYFEKNPAQFGGGSFEELTDRAQLRRAAASALFAALVRKAEGAEIQWFVPALHPPDGVPMIPGKQPSVKQIPD